MTVSIWLIRSVLSPFRLLLWLFYFVHYFEMNCSLRSGHLFLVLTVLATYRQSWLQMIANRKFYYNWPVTHCITQYHAISSRLSNFPFRIYQKNVSALWFKWEIQRMELFKKLLLYTLLVRACAERLVFQLEPDSSVLGAGWKFCNILGRGDSCFYFRYEN